MPFSFVDFDTKVTKAKEHIRQDLGTLRTGKATTQLLDSVMVEAYGTYMKLNEVGAVSAPDPHMLVVSPWDKGLLPAVEKGIASAGLNLSPVVDGQIIRISVPPLTQERRIEMVKILNQKIEAGKVMIRTIRTEVKKEIDSLADADGVSEDEVKLYLQQLEDKMKLVLADLENWAVSKEKELMTV